jgi:hypothetical protein
MQIQSGQTVPLKEVRNLEIVCIRRLQPANRKTGFYANHEPNKQEVGFVFAWSGSKL